MSGDAGPAVLGIVGWSGSGKTTLILKLLPLLVARGLRVATIKHAHHHFDVDVPGKDSYEHRRAGAFEVLVSSSRRWAHMHEAVDGREATLAELLARISPCDLVLVEGFKSGTHRKLEVHRPALGKPPLYPEDPAIIAVASDRRLSACALPQLDLDEAGVIADFVVREAVPQPGA